MYIEVTYVGKMVALRKGHEWYNQFDQILGEANYMTASYSANPDLGTMYFHLRRVYETGDVLTYKFNDNIIHTKYNAIFDKAIDPTSPPPRILSKGEEVVEQSILNMLSQLDKEYQAL